MKIDDQKLKDNKCKGFSFKFNSVQRIKKDNNNKNKYKLMNKVKSGLAILLLLVGFASTMSINNSLNAQPPRLSSSDYKFGPLLGAMMDKNGKLEWIISGEWRSSLLNNYTVSNNASQVFNAAIDMIRPNGTERHTHTITEFKVLNVSQTNSNGTVYSGNSAISLMGGPVLNVPTTIKVFNNTVISILLDPTKVKQHFGEGEIYGIVSQPRHVEQHNENSNSKQYP